MDVNVFRRVEQKYLITNEQREKLLELINEYIEKDEYFESQICNIYFDNKDNEIIHTSLEKPPFKEKVRLRSYSVPKLDSKVFFEIKDKYKGIVGKRRIKLKLEEYYDYLENGNKQDTQIMKEIDYYYKMYNLEPFVFVGYDRKSYKGKKDKHLRLTFDQNLRYRFDDLKLDSGDHGKKYFDDDHCIMEIKILDSMPLWLASSLSKCKIYPKSFSKVGSIYAKNKRSESVC